ncbi:hypothetical protein HYALB_00004758 [Hymenoscyphus albidus]|uniref:Uncharacterized protein n=1 Tax=Hymenoscyphus albidus TaxID=595503 RepID=A0A9N9LV91_9HELO|nr:hypothetical protein HYALB_00004758 [Hymenoscyphus albidus]
MFSSPEAAPAQLTTICSTALQRDFERILSYLPIPGHKTGDLRYERTSQKAEQAETPIQQQEHLCQHLAGKDVSDIIAAMEITGAIQLDAELVMTELPPQLPLVMRNRAKLLKNGNGEER